MAILMCELFVNLLLCSAAKKNWYLLVIYAAAGVGKTRFGYDFLKQLLNTVSDKKEYYEKQITIYYSQKLQAYKNSQQPLQRKPAAKPTLAKFLEFIKNGTHLYVDFSNGDLVNHDTMAKLTHGELKVLALQLVAMKLVSSGAHFGKFYGSLAETGNQNNCVHYCSLSKFFFGFVVWTRDQGKTWQIFPI